MKHKSLEKIINRIGELKLSSKFDLIVGIANGGIVPSYLIHSYLKLPLKLIWINFRNKMHKPKAKKPLLTKPLDFEAKSKNVLLVDDRSHSGATLAFAKELLKEAKSVKTLVVNGKADYFLFDEDCFTMPWDLTKIKTVC